MKDAITAFDRILADDFAGRKKRKLVPAEAEERPTRAELLTAVEEAHAALHLYADDATGRGTSHEAAAHVTDAHEALHRVGAGQPREKTPVERRADEIEAEADYAADEAATVACAKLESGDRAGAAAWLLVAQRMLAREAGR